MGSWGGLAWLGPLFGLTLFVGLIALLALGAIWLFRRAGRPAATVPETGSEPLEIARRRLASGEITASEFEELRQQLQG